MVSDPYELPGRFAEFRKTAKAYRRKSDQAQVLALQVDGFPTRWKVVLRDTPGAHGGMIGGVKDDWIVWDGDTYSAVPKARFGEIYEVAT